ncbi:carbonic anhydrase [Hyphobacterium sp. HN65]|uniref:Carbonic anhydrase n=1 Tax=Hyphobacterium lacteum TaxID=3116575 RepID=A0ABU7LTW8_9PROT|nr:carbonic anhydrase [Hyphobacterium sp. HN65]MEE2527347.1 carbonic anhydrase [Hyphobacterium sp. HN65]
MPKRSMPTDLSDGFDRFRAELYPRQHKLFEDLADRGQKPHTLVVACCDSRVDPAQIFDARPGELFVVRNVANLVPPCEMDGAHHGVSAALEFAVKKLEVPNILVLGHRHCGGVNACVCGEHDADSMFIEHWIEPIEIALADARAELPDETDIDALSDRTELCSIRRSMERLLTYPFVAERVENGTLRIHGARFGIADGELEWLNIDGDFTRVDIRS